MFFFFIYQNESWSVFLVLLRIWLEWDVWHFFGSHCFVYTPLYIAFWAIAACPWVPTLSECFPFCVNISWWINSCFCLMKANSCNMQELWPLNKITVQIYNCSLCVIYRTCKWPIWPRERGHEMFSTCTLRNTKVHNGEIRDKCQPTTDNQQRATLWP